MTLMTDLAQEQARTQAKIEVNHMERSWRAQHLLKKQNSRKGVRMSEEEIIAAFKCFDKDGSGKIDVDDFRQAMTMMGEKMTNAEFDQMVEDAGGGSTIKYEKFVKEFNAKAKDDPDEE